VLLITADLGHSAARDVSGGFNIKVEAVQSHMDSAFPSGNKKEPVVSRVRPGWSFVDVEQMESKQFTLEEIANNMRGLTELQSTVHPNSVSGAEAHKKVLLTSFPGTWLPGMRALAQGSS
jgi:hypothetical protein